MTIIPFTSVEEFRYETKIQSKHFKNLSLNQYRQSIANRYGYKGIKLFEMKIKEQSKLENIINIFEELILGMFFSEKVRHFIKQTTNINLKKVSDVRKSIYKMLEVAKSGNVEQLFPLCSVLDFKEWFYLNQNNSFEEHSPEIAKRTPEEHYIVLWFTFIMLESEMNLVPICETFKDNDVFLEHCLPTEEKLYNFNQAVYFTNIEKTETRLITELICDLLNYKY